MILAFTIWAILAPTATRATLKSAVLWIATSLAHTEVRPLFSDEHSGALRFTQQRSKSPIRPSARKNTLLRREPRDHCRVTLQSGLKSLRIGGRSE